MFVEGAEVTQMSEEQLADVRRRVTMVFQSGALFDSLTVRENVGYKLYEETDQPLEEVDRRVEEVLGFIGLSEHIDKMPSELSGGEEQRVAIARALVTDPQIIIADEPTGDLDEESGGQVVDILARLSAEYHKTVIMVTHNPDAAERADRIRYLHRGRLVDRNPRELRAEEPVR